MEFIIGAAGLVSTIVLLTIVYGPWQSYAVDDAREEMFAARDRLFDLAIDGKIDFASDEYRRIRSAINSMIRYAHKMSLPLVLLQLLFLSKKDAFNDRRNNRVPELVSTIADNQLRQELSAIVDDVGRASLDLLVRRSLMLLLARELVRIGRRLGLRGRLTQFPQRRLSALQPMIFREAELNEGGRP
jgi:hypothetical protein